MSEQCADCGADIYRHGLMGDDLPAWAERHYDGGWTFCCRMTFDHEFVLAADYHYPAGEIRRRPYRAH